MKEERETEKSATLISDCGKKKYQFDQASKAIGSAEGYTSMKHTH